MRLIPRKAARLQRRKRHTVIRAINDSLASIPKSDYADLTEEAGADELEFSSLGRPRPPHQRLEFDMREAAKKLKFEKFAKLLDTAKELRTKEFL